MSAHVWWLFAITAFVASATPGPNMLLVMMHSAQYGLRYSRATMLGCLSAIVLMLVASAVGLGVFLKAWPAMFNALRLIGAGYLIWLGIKAWRAPVREVNADSAIADASRIRPRAPGAMFRNGFLVASSNPKAILFAAALLPQFIDAARPLLPQLGLLIATFALIEVSWYMVYASVGVRIGTRLTNVHVAKTFNRLTGGIFAGLGVVMALVRR